MGSRGALCIVAAVLASSAANAQGHRDPGPPTDRDFVVRAMVTAPNKALLSALISARVLGVSKRVGETFRQGETLVSFDCIPFEARLAAARAGVSGAETTLESTTRMFDLRSVGKHDVDLAKAAVQKAKAEAAIQDHDVRNCKVAAPYDGRVTDRKVGPHETVKAGDPLLSVLDHRELELELLVPSSWLRWLRPGTAFSVTLDATGRGYPAEIVRTGAQVDTASQSVQVFGRFKGAAEDVLSGMSGDVAFPSQPPMERR
ncbi:MAG: efflux RND transporter periplasmic adaptor subunit [Magnetospirillum sp. WYHS-4]